MRRGLGLQIIIVALCFVIAGCVRSIDLLDMDSKSLPSGEVIAYGRVEVVDGGIKKDWGDGSMKVYGPGAFIIFLLSQPTSDTFRYVLSDDGSFYWHLPPGEYTIMTFELRKGEFLGVRTRSGRISAKFKVPGTTSSVYLGTLLVEFDQGRYRMKVLDEFDQMTLKLKNTFPQMGAVPEKHLMELEKPL